MAITIRAVQALASGETIWDSGREAVKGFGVRRQLRTPVYVLKYRDQGQQCFVTIGPHGSPWTPEQARREAKRLLGLVAAGRDPRTELAKDKTSVRAVAEEYWATPGDARNPAASSKPSGIFLRTAHRSTKPRP